MSSLLGRHHPPLTLPPDEGDPAAATGIDGIGRIEFFVWSRDFASFFAEGGQKCCGGVGIVDT